MFARNHRQLFSNIVPQIIISLSFLESNILLFSLSLSLTHIQTRQFQFFLSPIIFAFQVNTCVPYLRSIDGRRSTTRNSEGSLPGVLMIERSRLPKDSSFPRNAQYTVSSAEPEVPRTELRRVSKARHFVGTRFIFFMHRFPLATGNGHDLSFIKLSL